MPAAAGRRDDRPMHRIPLVYIAVLLPGARPGDFDVLS
jgi:hypothetical protein